MELVLLIPVLKLILCFSYANHYAKFYLINMNFPNKMQYFLQYSTKHIYPASYQLQNNSNLKYLTI